MKTTTSDSYKDEEDRSLLLDWTSKQGRILTANGQGETYYTPERGYPYKEDELPHHHLLSNTNDTHDIFSSWAAAAAAERQQAKQTVTQTVTQTYPICGAWTRPLFVGGFEHSTNENEVVFNIQTNTLFIDMRIPCIARKKFQVLPNGHSNGDDGGNGNGDGNGNSDVMRHVLSQMNNDQLRLYARRHAFAGYTILTYHRNQTNQDNNNNTTQNEEETRPVCTRHHCIDWNFVGTGRNRPNKWFVEMMHHHQHHRHHPNHTMTTTTKPTTTNMWKEWAFAKDNFGQHYYWEKWERLANDSNGNGLVLALRKQRPSDNDDNDKNDKKKNNESGTKQHDTRDGIIVVVGDHFNYIFARELNGTECNYNKKSLVDVIDAAIEADDRQSAISYLTIDAGHGTISSGWVIDCALQYWREGTSLFDDNKNDKCCNNNNYNNAFTVNGSDLDSCQLVWNQCQWDIYESSISNVKDLEFVLQWKGKGKGESNNGNTNHDNDNKLSNILDGCYSRKRKLDDTNEK